MRGVVDVGLSRLESSVRGARGGLVSLAKTFEAEGLQEAAKMARDLVQDKFDRPGAPFELWTKKSTAVADGVGAGNELVVPPIVSQ
jgi:hypothetical protein